MANVRPGTVLSQTPLSGREVEKGSKVDLMVAAAIAARPTVSVPSVVKLELSRARATLDTAGLVVGTIRESDTESLRPGTVLSQSLGAGRQVEKGAKIDLVVAAPTRRTVVSQADYDRVQAIYIALRPMNDCREIRRLVQGLSAYYSNNSLVPEDRRYSVINPEKKSLPTIGDLARDRVIRIQGAKKDCF